MKGKDIFNAIQNVDDNYISDAWKNTESVGDGDLFNGRPVILRAEKKPRSAKRIAIGAVSAAAAVVVIGAGVMVGAKHFTQNAPVISDSYSAGSGKNFAPEAEIVRYGDIGYYPEKYIKKYNEKVDTSILEWLEWYYSPETDREAVDTIPPAPDVYYYNDTPLDCRMLSRKTAEWLSRYCSLSEEERNGETAPEELTAIAESGFVRIGDIGFIRAKHTEEELKHVRLYTLEFPAFADSDLPPAPDVYYYNDVPYNLDRLLLKDTREWLKWICWLDEDTQKLFEGYVPKELTDTFLCVFKGIDEFVTYKGVTLNMRHVSLDTESFVKWYNALSEELQANVFYEPQALTELREKAERALEIRTPDGKPLTVGDLINAHIYDKDNIILSVDEIDKWARIWSDEFVYLAEPGSDVFKKYHIGDEICGMRIKTAHTEFIKTDDGTPEFFSSDVTFDGEITVSAAFTRKDGMKGYKCSADGLPVISMDVEAFKQGKFAPKEHNASDVMTENGGVSEYFGTAGDYADRISANQGKILDGITLKDLHLNYFSSGQYTFNAQIYRVEGGKTLYDWAESGLHFPVDNQDGAEENFLGDMPLVTEYNGNVYAVDDGEVIAVRDKGDDNYGIGNYVTIKHGESRYTRYQNLSADKAIPVKVGDKVTKGQVIGYAGTTGEVDPTAVPEEGEGAVCYRFFSEIGEEKPLG